MFKALIEDSNCLESKERLNTWQNHPGFLKDVAHLILQGNMFRCWHSSPID